MQRRVLLRTNPGDPRPVYIAGNFNSWQPGEPEYQLQPTGQEGEYRIELQLSDGTEYVEYKFTRGAWDCVELERYGHHAPNRRHLVGSRWTHIDMVERWASGGMNFRADLLPRIEVISENFEIPQLIRTRRIAALLPHDYYETDRHYPVLYLQDGQNLFDDYAPFGNWGVDKRLAMLAELGKGDIIIVSIDHAREQRVAEFTPSFQTRLGHGDGKKYVRFLADTLKPYIDDHFRTLPAPQYTGIGGSSMGGLISIYAGMMYPEVYDKLMIFSPALWVAPDMPYQLVDLTNEFNGRIYLYGGNAESSTMVPNLERFQQELASREGASTVEFRLEIDPYGQHNEARWGEEFPKAIEWLFFAEE
ncbi:MAG: alpha/beta hydrolase-fold protein [Bacteroidota bacterium]